MTDPNEGLSTADIRFGGVKEVKVSKTILEPSIKYQIILKKLTKEEKRDERKILGETYQDKEFLR